MAQFYKATKEGFDGKQILKPGDVFPFAGECGSWMVPCDEQGSVNVPVVQERPTRLGTKVSSNLSRADLREECKKHGIAFKATAGAVELAELLQKHQEEQSGKAMPAHTGKSVSTENPDGGAPGVGTGGTGDQEVL